MRCVSLYNYATVSCTDSVRIYLDLERPELNGRQRPNFDLCGNLSSTDPLLSTKQLYSSRRSAVIEFRTGPIQRNNTGFRGLYRFIDASNSSYNWYPVYGQYFMCRFVQDNAASARTGLIL